MPVHKTSRVYLRGFVERLEGDGEVVDSLTFDGADVWVVTFIPKAAPAIQITHDGSLTNYETRSAS